MPFRTNHRTSSRTAAKLAATFAAAALTATLAAQDAFLSATDPVPETAATRAEAARILA